MPEVAGSKGMGRSWHFGLSIASGAGETIRGAVGGVDAGL